MMKKIKAYLKLIKSLQTLLLLLTGITGFISSRCPYTSWELTLLLILSLFLSISGTTVFNMVYDKDIDAKMARTKKRPLATGELSSKGALIFGIILTVSGLAIAFYLSILYGKINHER